tara:strand:- start:812 stop:931 length:120 start_codon:yes stop_codon:yes gene_type:complete
MFIAAMKQSPIPFPVLEIGSLIAGFLWLYIYFEPWKGDD